MVEKPSFIFVLGPPAPGKGTLCKLLAEKFNDKIFQLSAGDYPRHLIQKKYLAHQADIVDSVQSGGTREIVTWEVNVPLLMNKIKEEMQSGKFIFLLDGFPRDLDYDKRFKGATEAEFEASCLESGWSIILMRRQLTMPDLIISISCLKKLAKARYLTRKRGDDNEDLFEKRYRDYEQRDYMVVGLFKDKLITPSHLVQIIRWCIVLAAKILLTRYKPTRN